MSGLFGGGINTSVTRIEALQLQSSTYGATIPLVYGVAQIPGNMLWYGAFKASAQSSSSGGKGGSAKTTSYNYTASVVMGLCEGQITGISQIWKGKQLYAGGVLGTQLSQATENYTVPGPGGTYTVAQVATFSVNNIVSVTGVGFSGQDGWLNQALSENFDYERVGGDYTFDARWAGCTVAITYQYITGGGSQTALQAIGLSFAAGALGQSTWSYLTTNFSSQAIGYSGIANVYAQDYALASDASVDNHLFEVQGAQAFSISSSIPDANPAPVSADVLINGRYGAAFPSEQFGDPTAWSTYCLASGLLLSPALTTQMSAADFMTQMGKLTNTAPVWTSGRLKMVPYGDSALAANGATYTPDLTPVYDLGDDDYTPSSGGDPIKVTRLPQADAYNHIRIEFMNRANAYNVEIAEAKDSADIDANGLRSAAILTAHWICDAAIARNVAQLALQRALYVRNTYEFTLPWTKTLLEPMDLVTLTDSGLGFNKLPVRLTSIGESETNDLAVLAEDFSLGVATASLYGSQVGAGYQHDYNASPGSASAPLIFEAPGALTVNGLELYIAATGTGAKWGGCHVWVSLDGTSYKLASTLNGGSRYGALTNAPSSSGTVSVALLTGELTSGSAADATALNTLCFIKGAADEFFAFETATLTSALHYDLTSNVRGAYDTAAASHSIGDGFVRVDTAIAKSGPIDLGYVGKTVHVKLTSFNVYGAAEEDISVVTDYTYTITGAQVYGNAGAAALAGIDAASSDNILSAGEKPPVILDYTNVTGEQTGLDAEAVAYSVSHAAYDAALAALTSYLGGLTTPVAWNSLTGNTTIVGTTFRSTWAALYSARQALINAIATAAGTVATWAGVTGTGKPANNADVTSANTAAAIAGQGALATLNTVGTTQIAANAATLIETWTYAGASGLSDANTTVISFTAPADGTVELTGTINYFGPGGDSASYVDLQYSVASGGWVASGNGTPPSSSSSNPALIPYVVFFTVTAGQAVAVSLYTHNSVTHSTHVGQCTARATLVMR